MSVFCVTERYGWEDVGMLKVGDCWFPHGTRTDTVLPKVVPPTFSNFPSPSTPSLPTSSPVSVYVRVRPLLEEEKEHGEMEGIVTETSEEDVKNATAFKKDSSTIGGFSGVVGPEANNEFVFERCFESRIETVLKGGMASLFCYGYTGSGKSHTVLGYGEERGMYEQAAEVLMDRLEELYQGEGLFLVATACEIYGDSVYDLMGEEKVAAELRTGETGNVCVCGPAVRTELSDIVEGVKREKGEGEHATLVTRTRGLRCVIVKGKEDIDGIKTKALELRVVGSSTEHSQSSRSHAVLKMEIMNKEMFEAREEAEEARALVPPLLNAIENHAKECFNNLCDTNSEDNEAIGLKQLEGGQEEWERVRDELVVKKKALEKAVGQGSEVVARIEAAYERLRNVAAHEAVGGALVLVDLAGADYDKRDLGAGTTLQERKESADINKSLLALKECFRSISGAYGAKAKPNFRASKLTRILEDALLPGKQSERRNRSSESVMVVNVSPSEHIGKKTLNVLRYGQIFADGSAVKNVDKGSRVKQVKKSIGAAKKDFKKES